MNFEEWAEDYFGKNVDVPEACRDAWQAAIAAEREACAKVCDEYERGLSCPISGGSDAEIDTANALAKFIRARSNTP